MGIKVRNVGKVIGDPPTRVLTDISLDIADGEFLALTGRSGSGKSTLLYILSSLDTTTEGSVEINGRLVNQLSTGELALLRNTQVGFVFQFHYLLAELTALENVLMPAKKFNQEDNCRARAESLLEQFGLGALMHRLPRQLSGGEQQRVAIARSLVMNPRFLFADEPTGALDSISGDLVMKIFHDANEKFGTTVILVTHDAGFANLAQRRIHLLDGKIVD